MEREQFVVATGEHGSIAVTRDAIVEIVGHAVAESYGVVAFAGERRLSRLFPRGLVKGIDVELTDDGLAVEIRVVVEHGLKLGEVADAVRERVLYELERMVGLSVASLEVHIEKVR
ncbi:MAG TPA: Asp23/Gls24 family envelope stress response protein [Gaiellaceae bacterium]|nr:Asp23/Gls24 family envelope stress response protein [Gaiellaceae bacterium]